MRKFFLKSFVIVFSVFNFLVSCGGEESNNHDETEDINDILENAQIANNSITVTFSDESVFYYQTCMPLPVVKEDGKSEKMKNNPWECYIEATSLCGYWLDDEYQLPSGPGCDIVECKKAAGLSFVEFIGNYTAEEFKDIPEEHENSSCEKAPVSVAVPYKGKFTAELTLFTDENCKESVTASASFEN